MGSQGGKLWQVPEVLNEIHCYSMKPNAAAAPTALRPELYSRATAIVAAAAFEVLDEAALLEAAPLPVADAALLEELVVVGATYLDGSRCPQLFVSAVWQAFWAVCGSAAVAPAALQVLKICSQMKVGIVVV
jgi:hypothetical protein